MAMTFTIATECCDAWREPNEVGVSEGARQRLYAQLMFDDWDYRVCEVIVARLVVVCVFNAMVVVVVVCRWVNGMAQAAVTKSFNRRCTCAIDVVVLYKSLRYRCCCCCCCCFYRCMLYICRGRGLSRLVVEL